MKRIKTFLLALSLVAALAASGMTFAQERQAAVRRTHLKVGDMAPDFEMLSNKRERVRLSDFRGKKNVVLAFYVLAFTGG